MFSSKDLRTHCQSCSFSENLDLDISQNGELPDPALFPSIESSVNESTETVVYNVTNQNLQTQISDSIVSDNDTEHGKPNIQSSQTLSCVTAETTNCPAIPCILEWEFVRQTLMN